MHHEALCVQIDQLWIHLGAFKRREPPPPLEISSRNPLAQGYFNCDFDCLPNAHGKHYWIDLGGLKGANWVHLAFSGAWEAFRVSLGTSKLILFCLVRSVVFNACPPTHVLFRASLLYCYLLVTIDF